MSFFSAVVVTVSDRSYRGQRPDEAGPLVAELLREAGYTVVRTALVPDEQSQIAHILEDCRQRYCGSLSHHRRHWFFSSGRHAGGHALGL